MIKTVSIKSFAQSTKGNAKDYKIDDTKLKDAITNDKTATFEVFDKQDTCKLFFDIEKITLDDDEAVDKLRDIIKAIYEVLDKDIEKYPPVVTINHHSKHPGLSSHVIIPLTIHYKKIVSLIDKVVDKYPEYSNYIDNSIYINWRLFRFPYQYDCSKGGRLIKESIHKIAKDIMNNTEEYDKFSDYPGKISDFTIQYTEGLDAYDDSDLEEHDASWSRNHKDDKKFIKTDAPMSFTELFKHIVDSHKDGVGSTQITEQLNKLIELAKIQSKNNN